MNKMYYELPDHAWVTFFPLQISYVIGRHKNYQLIAAIQIWPKRLLYKLQ